jgi:phosphoesterase, MJ0936 family
MKIFIASDLHGDALRCAELISSFKLEGAERLLLLGDILYHGPRNDLPSGYAPKRVIELLNPLADKIICVRGNCDAEVDEMVLDFDVLTPKKVFKVNDLRLILTHGHHLDSVVPDGADAVLYGHTHVPAKELHGKVWYLNPGSVSIPKEKSIYSYMTLDEHTFYWKRLLDGMVYDTLSLSV